MCVIADLPAELTALVTQVVDHSAWTAECRGLESHPGQFYFPRKSVVLGVFDLFALRRFWFHTSLIIHKFPGRP